MRDGHNGYGPSPGIAPAREAVASELTGKGFPVSADRVLITAGTSEAIDLVLSSLVDSDSEVLVPMPTYPLYTALLAKIDARAKYYRADPARGWLPDLDHLEEPGHAGAPARWSSSIRTTRRAPLTRSPRAARCSSSPTATAWSSSPTRYTAISATTARSIRSASSIRMPRSSPSRACRRPTSRRAGEPAGWRSVARRGSTMRWPRSRRCPTPGCAARSRCSTRSPKRCSATGRISRSSAPRCAPAPTVTARRLSRHAGHDVRSRRRRASTRCRRSTSRRAKRTRTTSSACSGDTGVLCVYGSGFGMPADAGFFRVVFLASPEELDEIYDLMADFTARFRANS